MNKFSRTYTTLKFFREKRKNAELERLSEEENDFEYRRLLIEEREKDLHVAFSRRIVFRTLAFIFLGLSIITIKSIFITKIFLVISIIAFILMLIYIRKYKKILSHFNFALTLVDYVIQNTYGISLPKYL